MWLWFMWSINELWKEPRVLVPLLKPVDLRFLPPKSLFLFFPKVWFLLKMILQYLKSSNLPFWIILDWSVSISFSAFCCAWKLFPKISLLHCLISYFTCYNFYYNWYILDPSLQFAWLHQVSKMGMKSRSSSQNFSNKNGLGRMAKSLSQEKLINQWSNTEKGRISMEMTSLMWKEIQKQGSVLVEQQFAQSPLSHYSRCGIYY